MHKYKQKFVKKDMHKCKKSESMPCASSGHPIFPLHLAKHGRVNIICGTGTHRIHKWKSFMCTTDIETCVSEHYGYSRWVFWYLCCRIWKSTECISLLLHMHIWQSVHLIKNCIRTSNSFDHLIITMTTKICCTCVLQKKVTDLW